MGCTEREPAGCAACGESRSERGSAGKSAPLEKPLHARRRRPSLAWESISILRCGETWISVDASDGVALLRETDGMI